MKKNFFRMFAAILFCGAIATVFTACSKDDDDNNTTPTPEAQKNTAKTASAWYGQGLGPPLRRPDSRRQDTGLHPAAPVRPWLR